MVDDEYETLRRLYLEENGTQSEVAQVLGLTVKQLRNKLAFHELKKTQKKATERSLQTLLKRRGEFYVKHRGFGVSPDKTREAQIKARAKRSENRRLNLIEQGLTKESLERLYLQDNLSQKELCLLFDKTEKEMRNLLKAFELTKSKELRLAAQRRNTERFFADDELRNAYVAKVHATISSRYGNRWYRNTQSAQEKEIVEHIRSAFPSLTVVEGSYAIIKNPSTKAGLQVDIFLPELDLAIEYNGIYWHDKTAYFIDVANSTFESRERLKEKLCQDKSIELVHVWSDDYLADKRQILLELTEKIAGLLLV